MLELAKRLKENNSNISAIPAHTGVASTEITKGGDCISPLFQKLTKKMFGFIGQSPAEEAWPILKKR